MLSPLRISGVVGGSAKSDYECIVMRLWGEKKEQDRKSHRKICHGLRHWDLEIHHVCCVTPLSALSQYSNTQGVSRRRTLGRFNHRSFARSES